MIRLCIILACLFIVTNLFGERIDGPAYIRSQAQGVVMFTLHNNVEVSSSALEYGWYHIGVIISVTEEEWQDELIYRGVELKDITGKVIGTVLENSRIKKIESTQGQRMAQLTGYAYKTNIRVRSIPEMQLANYMSGIENYSIENMYAFLTEYKFIKKGILKDEKYQEFMIFESWVEQDSPIDRIRFLFAEGDLIAIIYSRELSISNADSYDLIKGQKIIIIREMPDTERQNIININRTAYLGIK